MKTEIEIEVTPEQLAELFINWGSDEQAKFINMIGDHFKKCDFNAELQCCYVADDINPNGRDFLYTLSNFVKVNKFNSNSPKIDTLINHYQTDGL